ncbi:MAG: hypothetical protein QMD85_00720 [Candidatus Aenigmarchaeota archaeon]|nr:hypothetical protein [Candidatus Aenigmarchaeota archaeon]
MKEEMSGKSIGCGNRTFILVTHTGDLEFYRTTEDFERILYSRFSSIGYVPETGVDRNGMICYRRKEILEKRRLD